MVVTHFRSTPVKHTFVTNGNRVPPGAVATRHAQEKKGRACLIGFAYVCVTWLVHGGGNIGLV